MENDISTANYAAFLAAAAQNSGGNHELLKIQFEEMPKVDSAVHWDIWAVGDAAFLAAIVNMSRKEAMRKHLGQVSDTLNVL